FGIQLIIGQPAYLDVKIDPIQKRARNALSIIVALPRTANARSLRIAVVAARTWIHRSDEKEIGRINRRAGQPDDADAFFLERLPKRLENVAIKLRKLVHEEDAVVRK